MQKLSSGKSLVSSFIACCWCGYSINANIKMSMHIALCRLKAAMLCHNREKGCQRMFSRQQQQFCSRWNDFFVSVFSFDLRTLESVYHISDFQNVNSSSDFIVCSAKKFKKRKQDASKDELSMPFSRFLSSRFFSRVCVYMYLPVFYLQSLNNAKSE